MKSYTMGACYGVVYDIDGVVYDVRFTYGSMHEAEAYRIKKAKSAWYRTLVESAEVYGDRLCLRIFMVISLPTAFLKENFVMGNFSPNLCVNVILLKTAMDFHFLIDVYADRHLIDAYIISFRLYDKSCVRVVEYEGREYVVEVLDWEAFKKSAKEVVLYEYGDEIARFSDIEVALSEAYRMSCIEASKRMPKVIEPAIGIGNPPPEVVEKVFPLNYKPTPFPENLDSFLEELVKNLEIESFEWEKADDDEIPF